MVEKTARGLTFKEPHYLCREEIVGVMAEALDAPHGVYLRYLRTTVNGERHMNQYGVVTETKSGEFVIETLKSPTGLVSHLIMSEELFGVVDQIKHKINERLLLKKMRELQNNHG